MSTRPYNDSLKYRVSEGIIVLPPRTSRVVAAGIVNGMIIFKVYNKKQLMGSFYVSQFPHNCGLGVLSGLTVQTLVLVSGNQIVDNSLPTLDLLQLAEQVLGSLFDFTVILYTVNPNQTDVFNALTKNGWSEAKQMRFTNNNTGNLIRVLRKDFI